MFKFSDLADRPLFARAAFFDALKQVVHAAAQFGGDVGFEMQFRDAEKFQPDGQLMAQKWAGMFERGQRLLGIGPFGYSDPNQRVSFVGRDLDASDDGRADAWIGKFVADQLGEFFAERFGNPLSTMWHVRLFNPLHA
jgi:hypothetical protein